MGMHRIFSGSTTTNAEGLQAIVRGMVWDVGASIKMQWELQFGAASNGVWYSLGWQRKGKDVVGAAVWGCQLWCVVQCGEWGQG